MDLCNDSAKEGSREQEEEDAINLQAPRACEKLQSFMVTA
jgi:hypothetical protein